jgi:hypothetical protein
LEEVSKKNAIPKIFSVVAGGAGGACTAFSGTGFNWSRD